MSQKNVKKRHWASVNYPESRPDDWLQILQASGVQAAISPMHDRDLDADGNEKKPHQHIILSFSGPTTFNSVKLLCEQIGAVAPQPLESVRGYYRYLTHKDNPEKAQYDERDIACLNGFDVREWVEMTRSEVQKIKLELQAIIRSMDIIEYCELMDMLQDNDMRDMYDVASNNTYFFEKYITSRRNSRKEFKKECASNV